jgi:long-chain acyl-CoA synthetase
MKTMIHLLNEQSRKLNEAPALWSKRDGRYQPTSWNQYARTVKHGALGLQQLGFASGQALVIIGFNREEWVTANLAAMACGGVAVGVYVTSSAEQMAYVIAHCEATMVLVENSELLDRVLSIQNQIPSVKHIFTMNRIENAAQKTWSDVVELGSHVDDSNYEKDLNQLKETGLAQLIYTSGTTGHPKGVMLSHHNLSWTAQQLSTCQAVSSSDIFLSYLPLSHIAEQLCTIYGPLANGLQVYFAESFEKLPENLKEARPTLFFGVPRVWEKFKSKAEQRISEQSASRQKLVSWARKQALTFHKNRMQNRPNSFSLRLKFRLAQRLVFTKLKSRIGLDRAATVATSAAPISLEVLEFFTSLDLPMLEIYGQSEVTGPTSVSTAYAAKLGKLGRAMPGVEVKIADDGEILVRGGNVCMGYFKNAEATNELIQNGWLHSGDIGEIDADGYLSVTGRKKEIIVTSGGKKTSPAGIEALIKSIAPIGSALVVGDNRNYLVAILALDLEQLPAFFKAHQFDSSATELVKDQRFLKYIEQQLEVQVNSKLSRFESIKKFVVIPNDFSIEGTELTSTLKLRRKVSEEKYRAHIEALYAVSSISS